MVSTTDFDSVSPCSTQGGTTAIIFKYMNKKFNNFIPNTLQVSDIIYMAVLTGKAKRVLFINHELVLDEVVSEANVNEYKVEEIRPMLFRISKGDKEWFVGSMSNPKLDIMSGFVHCYSDNKDTIILNSLDEIAIPKKRLNNIIVKANGKIVKLKCHFNGVDVFSNRRRIGICKYLFDAYILASKLLGVYVYDKPTLCGKAQERVCKKAKLSDIIREC